MPTFSLSLSLSLAPLPYPLLQPFSVYSYCYRFPASHPLLDLSYPSPNPPLTLSTLLATLPPVSLPSPLYLLPSRLPPSPPPPSPSAAAVTTERDRLKDEARGLAGMKGEMEELRAKADEVVAARKELAVTAKRNEDLEKMYKDEVLLRKRYWNMMEDMKGKIRVYARCRPLAGYEKERNCEKVVSFPDECTLELGTKRGPKQFLYDRAFTEFSTQEEIFEDTSNLIQVRRVGEGRDWRDWRDRRGRPG